MSDAWTMVARPEVTKVAAMSWTRSSVVAEPAQATSAVRKGTTSRPDRHSIVCWKEDLFFFSGKTHGAFSTLNGTSFYFYWQNYFYGKNNRPRTMKDSRFCSRKWKEYCLIEKEKDRPGIRRGRDSAIGGRRRPVDVVWKYILGVAWLRLRELFNEQSHSVISW